MGNIAKGLVGMIPGVGGIASAALGAFGNKVGPTTTNSQTQSTSNINQLNEVIEPSYFSDLRQGIIPYLMSGLQGAMNPIFTPQLQSQYLQGMDDSTNEAIKSAKNVLAKYGRLQSGAADTALTDLERGNFQSKVNFFNELPYKESEARQARLLPFLQLGAGWTGAAPTNQRMTGTQTQNSTTNSVTQGGQPSWGGAFLGGLGGQMAYNDSKRPTSLWDNFKGKW